MDINLFDFNDIQRETYNEYVSRYEIDLIDFKDEFGTNSEAKFIDYQRVYLEKMRGYIIENLSKIDNEDLDSQFYHDKLQEALSENKKMFHFLNVRLNPMNYILEQKNNTPASNIDEVQEFFNYMNNNRVNEVKMINFIESITESKIDKLKVFYKDIKSFEVEFITNKVVDNLLTSKVNNQDLSDSFEVLKTLVLDKIQEIENVNIQDYVARKENPFPDIFKSVEIYDCFIVYVSKHIIDFYADFSFLKKQLHEKNLIHNIKDKEFMDFLIDKEIINSIRVETCRDIFEKNSSKFSVKYKGTSRFNNFYSVFEAVI